MMLKPRVWDYPPRLEKPVLALQKASRFWSDLPQVGWQLAPLVYLLAKVIDEGCRVGLLLLGRKPFPFIEYNLLLGG